MLRIRFLFDSRRKLSSTGVANGLRFTERMEPDVTPMMMQSLLKSDAYLRQVKRSRAMVSWPCRLPRKGKRSLSCAQSQLELSLPICCSDR